MARVCGGGAGRGGAAVRRKRAAKADPFCRIRRGRESRRGGRLGSWRATYERGRKRKAKTRLCCGASRAPPATRAHRATARLPAPALICGRARQRSAVAPVPSRHHFAPPARPPAAGGPNRVLPPRFAARAGRRSSTRLIRGDPISTVGSRCRRRR